MIAVNLSKMKCWPLGGFAPGLYSCKCADCEKNFEGDKRAHQCLPCAVKDAKQMIDNLRGEVASLSRAGEVDK